MPALLFSCTHYEAQTTALCARGGYERGVVRSISWSGGGGCKDAPHCTHTLDCQKGSAHGYDEV